MQTSTATAPRRTSLDEYIRLNTGPVAPVFTKSVRLEREAFAAALAGEVLPAPVVPVVFALLPFAKVRT